MIRERRGLVQSLIAAIATKPFVLLAGISGSGKTQLARRLAAGLAAGLVDGQGLYTGRLLGDEVSGPSLRRMLVQNGVAPELEGADGNAFIDVRELMPTSTGDERAVRNLRTVMRDRVAFLPVRPDWSDSRQIWGYYNPLTGLYYPTDALRVALHAYLEYLQFGDAAPRHFLILDELNLARVEYYLSDLLSLMETPCRQVEGGVRMGEMASVHPFTRPLWSQSAPQLAMGAETSSQEHLFAGRMDTGWLAAYNHLALGSSGSVAPHVDVELGRVFEGADWTRLVPPRVAFTPNLCIIGTVNVDETTFGFAPKVLDRAFVLEFNEVDYDAVCADWPGYAELRDELRALYQMLRPANLHFGYRVVHEITSYLRNSPGGWASQGDFLLSSKVLPKLRGGEDKLGPVLAPLLVYAVTGERSVAALQRGAAEVIVELADGASMPRILELLGAEAARYPMTADKVFRMTRQLLDTGLASFF